VLAVEAALLKEGGREGRREGGRGGGGGGAVAQDTRTLRLLSYFLAGMREEEKEEEEEEEREEVEGEGETGREGARDGGGGRGGGRAGGQFEGVKQRNGAVLDPQGKVAEALAGMVRPPSLLPFLPSSFLPSLPLSPNAHPS